ncbi:MAG: hypothetical protein WBD40_02730, partial [Tepidisphaeraceae bacterium]
MRRWSLRILIALAILLLVVIAVTQAVLSLTDIPDRIVLTQVQQTLGLRMTAKSVDTGWFGTTTIRDVTLSLPLAEQSLLATPQMRVRHTWLPKLLFTRKLVIDLLTLDDAQLVVRQDAAGRWNLQELVELLARTAGKQQVVTTPSTRRAGPRLPGVILHNGTVTVTDNANRVATLAPLEFSGLPDPAAPMLVWRYDVKVPALLSATGQLSPGFEWAHQVDFDVTHANGVLKPWIGELTEPLNVAGRWEGALNSGQAAGRLVLSKFQAAGFDVSGIVRVSTGGGTARIEPEQLLIKSPPRVLPDVHVASGAIEMTGPTIRATRLKVAALNGVAQVDGRWATDQNVGELVATWDELAQPIGVKTGGKLTAAVTTTLGQPSVTADLVSNGTYNNARWNTKVNLTGSGRGWEEMSWVVTAPNLSWSGPPRDVMLDGLVARLVTRTTPQAKLKAIELTSVQLPSADRVAGTGSVDLITKQWSLNLDGRGWPIPRLPESTFEFRLAGGGDFQLYKLTELYLKSGDIELAGSGVYDLRLPKPLDLSVRVKHLPKLTETDPTLQGNLRGEAHVTGVGWPLSVALTGKVLGEAIRVKGHALGDLAIDVEGKITDTQASLTSNELGLLGGRWSLVGTWLKEKDLSQMIVKVRDLPLSQCGLALGRSDVDGTLAGAWTFDLPAFDRSKLTMAGDFDARGVRVGAFPAERAVGKVAMRNRRVALSPVELTQSKGTARVNASFALDAPRKPTIGITTTNWPVDLPAAGSTLSVSSEATLDLDLETRSASGPVTATADVTLGAQPLGQARVEADFSGHAAQVRSL